MSLRNWLDNGWLTEHRTSRQEIAELFSVADRDMRDSDLPGLSPDWKLAIAYNAALQSATAALAAAGYRAVRQAHHYRVIQSLSFTIDLDPLQIRLFDTFRKKRNIGGYVRAGSVSEHEADEMNQLAVQIRDAVEKYLQTNHPELLDRVP